MYGSIPNLAVPSHCGAVAQAEVTSANIVGYQHLKLNPQKTIVTPSFRGVGTDQKIDLNDIVPMREVEGNPADFAVSPGTARCNGAIVINKILASGNYAAAIYYYYMPGNKIGWYTNTLSGTSIKIERGEVTFAEGEAMLLNNTYQVSGQPQNTYLRVSGEVDLDPCLVIEPQKHLIGNSTPFDLDLTDIKMMREVEGLPADFAVSPGTARCNGAIVINKILPSGNYAPAIYYYHMPGDKIGWYTNTLSGTSIKINPKEITFTPGEAMLLNNTYGNSPRVYMKLPKTDLNKSED